MSLQQRITALAQAVGADIRKLDVSRHPAIRPSLRLDFINCARLDPRIAFTRASGAGRFNAAGQYEWLAADQPRFDYDPVTGEAKGLLIEEQRTNLLTYSSDFANWAWLKLRATVEAVGAYAPNGSAALLLREDSSSGTHYISENVSVSAGMLAATIYVKPAGRTAFRLASNTGNIPSAEFDISAMTATPVGTSVQALISPAGNGWFKCTVVRPVSSASEVFVIQLMHAGSITYQGDGTSGIYIWGAQLEAGSSPSSYIPTTDAQVTRAASDPLLQTLSPWLNQSAGTFIIEHDAVAGRPLLSSGETLLASSGGAGRTVLAYDATGSYVSQNGGAFVAGPPLTFADSLRLMRSATQWANAHCRALRYYPRRLTLAEASA